MPEKKGNSQPDAYPSVMNSQQASMKKPTPRLFRYLAALVIGVIFFATFWESLFGTASNLVAIAGVCGVVVVVICFLSVDYEKNKQDDNE
jgi:hypothetical protein